MEEMPATLEVLRKYDDLEHRRRSATLRADSSVSSSDSRRASSFDRARHSGVNRLLRDSITHSGGHSHSHHSSSDGHSQRSTGSDTHHVWSNPGSMPDESTWSYVVLKMTSFSEDDVVTSFRFSEVGGCVGRDPTNVAAIPADKLLAPVDHAHILYWHGHFYLENGSPANTGTFVRLTGCGSSLVTAKEEDKMQWPLSVNTVFRAGKSDFHVTSFDEATQTLELSVKSGKLAGQVYTVGANGAGIGRSAENLIHAGDGELSRKHCAIWFDELTSQFYLVDLSSTNGTFMKLTGPYQDPYRLEIGDDLLISQTCLTVNRFDYGTHANMGARKHMEDAHTVVQDLQISQLTAKGLYPQSFFAVYDGHGGMEASSYLGETLHHNIQAEFRSKRKQFDPDTDLALDDLYGRIEECLTAAFQRTDDDFLTESERPQAGSTATTVFIAGDQLFVANVGDSRTVLSRDGVAVRLSNDHKPNRPDEAQRIRETGGFVIHGRIMGELAVSRAFGDSPFKTYELPQSPKPTSDADAKPRSEYDSQELPVNPNDILKGPMVIPTPEFTRTELTGAEEFVMLASDGLFDVLKDQEAVDYVRRKIVELGDVQRAVEATVEHAVVQQRSMDNVTAVVVMFKDAKHIAAAIASASQRVVQSTDSTSSLVSVPPVTLTSLPPPPPPSTTTQHT